MIKYDIKPRQIENYKLWYETRVSWQRPRRQIWPRTGVQEPAGAGQHNHDDGGDHGSDGDGDGGCDFV